MTINAVITKYKETSPAAHSRLSTEIVAFQRGIGKRSVSVAVTLLLFALLSCRAFADAQVVRNGDRLSVDFHQATLSQVVDALQRDARIVVRLPASLNGRKITISFQNLEIGAATKKLLMSASLKSRRGSGLQPRAEGPGNHRRAGGGNARIACVAAACGVRARRCRRPPQGRIPRWFMTMSRSRRRCAGR